MYLPDCIQEPSAYLLLSKLWNVSCRSLAISLDATNDNEEECSLLDFIPSDFDTFEEVLERQDKEQYTDKAQEYISKLSNQQVNILNLLMDGYKPIEIREILRISTKEYTDNLQIMRAYENVKILF